MTISDTALPSNVDYEVRGGDNYPYVEIALGGVQNRNHIIRRSELNEYAIKWRRKNGAFVDFYESYFRYPEDMREHFNKVKTVKGYKGMCYALFFRLDIDAPDLSKAQEGARALLLRLQNDFDVDLKTLRIFFSGAKGFHIEIPAKAFGFVPSRNLHRIFKAVAERITPEGVTIDSAVYDKTRLWRLANTINSKTWLYKIPLRPNEVFNMPIDEIKVLASQDRREEFHDQDTELNPLLSAVYKDALDDTMMSLSKTKANGAAVKKYEGIFNGGIKEGERNASLTSLAGHLKAKGHSLKEAAVIVHAVNKDRLDPPLETEEVDGILESVYSYEKSNSETEIKFKNDKDSD